MTILRLICMGWEQIHQTSCSFVFRKGNWYCNLFYNEFLGTSHIWFYRGG